MGSTTSTTSMTSSSGVQSATSSSNTQRIVAGIIGVLIPVADQVFHWHLNASEIIALVTPVVVFIGAEAHVEAALHTAMATAAAAKKDPTTDSAATESAKVDQADKATTTTKDAELDSTTKSTGA